MAYGAEEKITTWLARRYRESPIYTGPMLIWTMLRPDAPIPSENEIMGMLLSALALLALTALILVLVFTYARRLGASLPLPPQLSMISDMTWK